MAIAGDNFRIFNMRIRYPSRPARGHTTYRAIQERRPLFELPVALEFWAEGAERLVSTHGRHAAGEGQAGAHAERRSGEIGDASRT